MALSLQLGGVSRQEIDSWLGEVVDAVPEAVRSAIIDHMLYTAVLADDAGVLGLGARGEQEFGRRHFSDIVSAFSEPLLLSVRHGAADLGTVHPASLVPCRNGDSPVLSLGGRSWKVADIDWRRRAVSVVPSEGGGRSHWLGVGRAASRAVCMMIERIVAGAEPACRLSRRAEIALAQIRDRLAFVDEDSLPIVSDGRGRVVIWAFAGGAATGSIVAGLAAQGLHVIGFDDLSITLRTGDREHVAKALRRIDPESILSKIAGEPWIFAQIRALPTGCSREECPKG